MHTDLIVQFTYLFCFHSFDSLFKLHKVIYMHHGLTLTLPPLHHTDTVVFSLYPDRHGDIGFCTLRYIGLSGWQVKAANPFLSSANGTRLGILKMSRYQEMENMLCNSKFIGFKLRFYMALQICFVWWEAVPPVIR